MERKELRHVAKQIVSGRVFFIPEETLVTQYGMTQLGFRPLNKDEPYYQQLLLSTEKYKYFLNRLRIERKRLEAIREYKNQSVCA